MKSISLIMLLLFLIMHPNVAKSSEGVGQLFLVGGGLKSCTSMSIKNCTKVASDKIKQLKDVKHSNLYQINDASIERVNSLWPKHFEEHKKTKVSKLLNMVKSATASELLTLNQLNDEIRKRDSNRLFNTLSDPEYYTLLDLLEQPVTNTETGKRLKEYVDLNNSTNVFSTHIYKHFVQSAKSISGKNTPNVVVFTASSRDIFEAADFYQAAFSQAGANSQWLPLDATLNALMQEKGERKEVCKSLTHERMMTQGSVNREFVYPDLTEQQMQVCLAPESILQAIKSADGVFLNGGDQSLTLKAFINKDGSENDVLKLIKSKLKENKLIVGGTSAGTAVMAGGVFNMQTIPMITNGQSDTAIIRGAKKDQLPVEGCHKSNQCEAGLLNDDLTYRSAGGLGLFKWGVTDTHFSERGRQGRLAQLVLDTNIDYGFGVDEATALVVHKVNDAKPKFSVIGQGGVFIVENTTKRDVTEQELKRHVKTHYINLGDTATLSEQGIKLDMANWKNPQTQSIEFPEELDAIFDGLRFKQSAELLCRSSTVMFEAQDKFDGNTIQITVSKSQKSKIGFGVVQFEGIEREYCSYQNFDFDFDFAQH